MLFWVNHSLSVPIYVQLMDQVKHAIEMGALLPGEQLPTIRKVAEDLVVNPNTVARAYKELEHEKVIEVRHGAGAFVVEGAQGPSKSLRKARVIVQHTVERLIELELSNDEIRRLMDNEIELAGGERSEAGIK